MSDALASPTHLVVQLLLASPAVRAIVGDRIESEAAGTTKNNGIIVRQITGRYARGLAGPVGLMETQLAILCNEYSVTKADALARVVRNVMHGAQNSPVRGHRVSAIQEGQDSLTAVPNSPFFARITAYRVHVSEA